jgi:hypothetical protein
MTELTITAEQISHRLPMRAICLDPKSMHKGQVIVFFRNKLLVNKQKGRDYLDYDWMLLGRTVDRSSFFVTSDKNEKFGVIENEENH